MVTKVCLGAWTSKPSRTSLPGSSPVPTGEPGLVFTPKAQLPSSSLLPALCPPIPTGQHQCGRPCPGRSSPSSLTSCSKCCSRRNSAPASQVQSTYPFTFILYPAHCRPAPPACTRPPILGVLCSPAPGEGGPGMCRERCGVPADMPTRSPATALLPARPLFPAQPCPLGHRQTPTGLCSSCSEVREGQDMGTGWRSLGIMPLSPQLLPKGQSPHGVGISDQTSSDVHPAPPLIR